MKIIQIFGLGHSGTTFTDRLLSCHPGVIGLGEVSKVLERLHRGSRLVNVRCPCGGTAQTCPVWTRIIPAERIEASDYYARVVAVMRELGATGMVDSSKDRGQIRLYRAIAEASGGADATFVLRLLRDPRGWVQSMLVRKKIDEADHAEMRAHFYEWLLSSIRLDQLAGGSGSPFGYVWYDALVLERQERELAALIGLDPLPPGPVRLGEATQHALNGNQFVHTDRALDFHYDARWLRSGAIEEVYATLPDVRAYYHATQALHLKGDRRIANLPRFNAVRLLQRLRQPGGIAEIEGALAEFDMTAAASDVPADPTAAKEARRRARVARRRKRATAE